MRTGIGPLSCSPAKPRSAKLLICAGAFLTSSVALAPSELARAAEFGADPWIKGFTDIYAGILPSVPGLYFRTDAYHYEAFAERTVFNGFVQLGVEQDLTATIMTLTYVTPWKILGGTYAFGVAPAMMAVNVDVGLGLPQFTGPRGNTFGPFNFEIGDTNLAPGDTGIIPILLGWNSGNFHWNFATFALAPTGDYSRKQLANTSLNHWAIMPRVAATYFDPKTGWQLNGSAIYVFNFENETTDYESGEILNLEGNITKNFGRWSFGVTAYSMIQTTGDSGAGARLGAFESRVNGIGPLVSYTLGDPKDPLTFIAKYYKEFDAKNTFEGEAFDFAVTAKF
jgi:hypothetical protein